MYLRIIRGILRGINVDWRSDILSDKTKHILRYGTHAEQKYIEKMVDEYDILTINSNMLAYSSSAIAEFIMMNFLTQDKGFFIDPLTHAFQHNVKKLKSYSKRSKKLTLKRSIEKLIEIYGEPIYSNIINDKVILPTSFDDKEIISEFCKRVIGFQLNTIPEQLEEKGFMEYIEPSGLNISTLKPLFIIPPYFYMKLDTINEWLDLNIEFIKVAKELYEDKTIFGELVINKDILTSEKAIDKICNAYSSLNINGLLLWIDDFSEHDVPGNSLRGYTDLVKKLYDNGIDVYNLYGGFFSIILTGFDDELGFRLSGVGHGLEYGEYRAVVPVGGGIPTSKYYYYPLHNRIDYATTSQLLYELGILNEDSTSGYGRYKNEICNCDKCHELLCDDMGNFSIFENSEHFKVKIRGTVQRRTYANQETKEACLIHYLFCKTREFDEVKEKSLKEFISDLDFNYNSYLELGVLSLDALSYLQNWVNVLKDYDKSEVNQDG